MLKKLIPLLACSIALILAGCSGPPEAVTKAPEKPPEAVTGQTALWKMFQVARAWAPDAEILKVTTIHLTEVPEAPGKAGAWEATFTSAAKGHAKSYTYSVIEGQGTLHQGVFGAPEEDFTSRPDATPFPIAAIKTDTDAALNMALANGGYDFEKKVPRKLISFVLEKLPKFANPAWRVIWGESAGTSNFSIYVDAMTDDFLERLH
jgi:hypothetical protein